MNSCPDFKVRKTVLLAAGQHIHLRGKLSISQLKDELFFSLLKDGFLIDFSLMHGSGHRREIYSYIFSNQYSFSLF
jgi:hypothetical protein